MTVAQLKQRDRLAIELKDVDEGGNQLHFPFRETGKLDRRADSANREHAAEREVRRKEWRKIALRLVAVGYRELAKELHLGAGRQSDDIALLNDVQRRLKKALRASAEKASVNASIKPTPCKCRANAQRS